MSDSIPDTPKNTDNLYVILALQGGGALGAFQAGAYQALNEKQYEPDWVAGISIGAINASIIAGNKQEDRLDCLKDFWDVVAGDLDWWERIPNYSEKLTNVWRICLSMAGGVSGFFRPNYIPGPFADPNSQEACSLYNTEKLKTTLKRLVKIEFLNNYTSEDQVCLSLGVTRVFGGMSRRFQNFDVPNIPMDPDNKPDPDNKRTYITADYIMASGALPPWFPGVYLKDPSGVVDDKQLYWDGGITSNSSLKHIIEHLAAGKDKTIAGKNVIVFVVDLWGAYDREPKTFDEVCWRIKQTQYSSRIEQDIKYAREVIHSSRQKIHSSGQNIHSSRQKPAAGSKKDFNRIDIIRISYRSHPNEIPCGDALFSRTELDRRFRDGYAAMRYRLEMDPLPWKLNESEWGSESRKDTRVAVHLF